MDSAVACKDAELPSDPKKLPTEPSEDGAPSPAAITAQGKEVRRYGVLAAPKTVSQMLSLIEDVTSPAGSSQRLARWVAKEDDEAVYLKVPMPGMGKEHVKARAEKNILVIKGGGDDGSAVPTYNRRIEMPADAYKMDQIKGEMKNGVLWLTVPKLKEEERKDVFEIKIE